MVRARLSWLLALLALFAVRYGPARAQILYDASQFGAVDLIPKQSAFAANHLLETLGAQIDRFEPIADFRPDDPIRKLGRAIGRLDILMTDATGQEGVAVCTAALIDRDKIVTNHHCIPGGSGEKITGAQIRFGYLELGSTSSVAFDVDIVPLETDRKLDYSILKVRGDPAAQFAIAPLKPRSVAENERLFVIHHPAGQPQRLTRAFCRAHPTTPLVNGFVRHQCDTLPGSSGSPIFAQTDDAFVGLHHAGGLSAADPKSFNEGIDAGVLTHASVILRALTTAKAAAVVLPKPVSSLASPPEPPCGGMLVAVAQSSERPCIEPGSGASFKDCPECPEMVVAPAGSFIMGSPDHEPERYSDEGPQHRVTIPKPFAVGKFAVTFAEWDACEAGGGCGGYIPQDQGWGRADRPVINVSWDDAEAYVKWLSAKTGKSYRLLSEAEFEYAARAGTTTPFWWGSSITPEQANYDGNYTYAGGGQKGEYRHKTLPVKSFKPNPWGLYQVHGNVWSWTQDCWAENYNDAPKDGSARTISACPGRVLRGGSWYDNPRSLRAARRFRFNSGYRFNVVGFRVARTF
jgi:formylglycine-generating enzyme required for sulfatase activity